MQASAWQQHKALTLRTQYRKLTPAGATPEGVQRALDLCSKKVQRNGNKSDPDAKADCLQNLVEVGKDPSHPSHSLFKQRTIPGHAKGRWRNPEFLMALILQAEGYAASVPAEWLVPHDQLPQVGSKRNSPEAPGTPESEDRFDLQDRSSI